MTTTTNNLALTEPNNGAYVNTWDVPVNNNTTILDQMFGNTTSISVSTSSTPSFTVIPAPSTTAAGGTSQAMRFLLTGALAANQTVLIPQYNSVGISGMWVFSNVTTNAFTVTIGVSNTGGTAAAGNTVTVPQGFNALLYSDGTNVYKADDGLVQFPVPVSLGGTGLTTLTANNVILGNGTSTPSFVPPTANGNVLTASFTPISVFNGSISGTTLTVASITSGTIAAGQTLTGTGVTAGTTIVSGSGLSWQVSASQTVSSTTITGSVLTWSSAVANASGRLISETLITNTSTTSFTTASTCNTIYFELLGGGGGGGGSSSDTRGLGGGGGGGGAYLTQYAISVTPSTTYTISVGAGGTSGSTGSGTGGSGGNTSITIGSTTYTAGGGSGGVGGVSGGTGGAGGTTTNGSSLSFAGVAGSTSTAYGARGGNPVYLYLPFGGAALSGYNTAGSAATAFGCGGGGASPGAPSGYIGGAGSQGFIRIWQYT